MNEEVREDLKPQKLVFELPEFNGNSVPVDIAAAIMGKDPLSIRQAMIHGDVDLGFVTKREGSKVYTFYISPFKLWQLTGHKYVEGEEVIKRKKGK